MKPKHTFLYCLTVLLIENALFLLAVLAILFATESWQSVERYKLHHLLAGLLALPLAVTLPRVLLGQILANILLHLRALSRARGQRQVLWRSIVINAGTLASFCMIVVSLQPTYEQYFDLARGVQRGLIGWCLLAASLIAPVLALRLWRRALLAHEQAGAATT